MEKGRKYRARIVHLSTADKVPEEFASFLRFGAFHEKRELQDSEKVAIVQVVGTESYFPIFLERNTRENVKEILSKYQAELEPASLLTIRENLKDKA